MQIDIAESRCGVEGGIFERLRSGNEFPHTIFARDFDHTALGGSHIHLELAIFREIVHLTNVLAAVFVVDKDAGPVIARHLRGIFGRKGEFHLAGGRSLDEDNAIEKVVSGFFGLRRRGLRLCTLCERSHQQAGSQNGGQASLHAEGSRETANR